MSEVPQLKCRHARQFLKIVMKARSNRLPRADRWRFFDLILEGAQAFTSRPLPPRDRRQAFADVASDARSLAKNLGMLLASDEPLFEDGSFAQTLALQHRLIEIAKHYESNTPLPKVGKPPDGGHFMLLVSWLAKAWTLATGRPAGTTWYPAREVRAGHFVDFVNAVLMWLEPAAPRRKALGDSVRGALANLKDWSKGEHT